MDEIIEISERVYRRFSLTRNAFGNGFLYFFGIANNPMLNSVESYLNKDIANFLRRDTAEIAGDFNRVFKRESEPLDVEI